MYYPSSRRTHRSKSGHSSLYLFAFLKSPLLTSRPHTMGLRSPFCGCFGSGNTKRQGGKGRGKARRTRIRDLTTIALALLPRPDNRRPRVSASFQALSENPRVRRVISAMPTTFLESHMFSWTTMCTRLDLCPTYTTKVARLYCSGEKG
jgi:hypothetical protein